MKKLILCVSLLSITFYGFSQNEDTNKELLRTTEKILEAVTQQSDSARAASIRVTTNEIGLDIFDLALLRTIDITYEYIKNSEIGFGVTARYCLDPDASSGLADGEKYAITPFFRYYFFSKKDYGSKGFYAEAFLKCFGGKVDWYNSSSYYSDNSYYVSASSGTANYFDVAFGVGLGYKYVNRSGFFVDLNLGLGRSSGLSDKLGDTSVGRGGITVGFRF